MTALIWYVPTFYGDIRLETEGDKTRVVVDKLSPSEVAAIAALRQRALEPSFAQRRWATEFPTYRSDSQGSTLLDARIHEVERFLVKQLKPGRTTLTGIRFADGRVEEHRISDRPEDDAPPPVTAETPEPESPYRAPAETVPEPAAAAAREEKKPKADKPEKAVTVAQPVQGCPAPDFEQAELRANVVLEAFLDPEQIEDFRKLNQFVSVGAETGHRYLLTSRRAPQRLRLTGGRSVFDVDEQRAFCVHDWVVPAAEELLALHLFLSLPGREGYLRAIPE